MADNLKLCIKLIFGEEGGYVNHPSDPGGATKYGITASTLGAWRKLGRKATPDEVKTLTLDEASQILQAQYAAPIWFDKLPAGLDYAVLDYSVNSGPSKAVKDLQRLLKISVDGQMGIQTLTAVNESPDLPALINQYLDNRLKFLKSLKTWSTFGNGWTNRIKRVRSGSLAMVVSPGATPVPDPEVEVSEPAEPPVGQADPADTSFIKTPEGQAVVTSAIGTASTGIGAASTALQPILGLSNVFQDLALGLTVLGVVVTIAGIVWKGWLQVQNTKVGDVS